MQNGNWVPLSKALVKSLPKGRPYSEVEAAFCLSMDYDAENRVTLSGYAALWQWGKGRVIRFLQDMGVVIEYPESTSRRRNQSGLIVILKSDQNRSKNGLKRLIDSKWLSDDSDQNQTDNGLKTDQSRYTTIDPNPKSQSKKTFSSDSAEFRLAEHLLNSILSWKPDLAKKDLQSWAKHIDLMIRKDKRTPEKIRAVIDWCQQDSFWRSRVMGTDKLRKQFDTLDAQMQEQPNGQNRRNPKPASQMGTGATATPGKYSGLRSVATQS